MTTLPKPQAILFDWDNTLVDTWPLIHAALNETLRYMNQPEWPLSQVRAVVKKSMRDSFPELFGERWKEAADVYQKSYRSRNLTHLIALPGADAMLAAIPRPDVFVAVVSNKQGPTLRQEVPALGWEKYFNAAIGATDAARDKPHGDPALLALKDSGVEPGPHVWFIGDTNADLGCAAAIGATAVLYGDHDTDGITLSGDRFDVHVEHLDELRELIRAAF